MIRKGRKPLEMTLVRSHEASSHIPGGYYYIRVIYLTMLYIANEIVAYLTMRKLNGGCHSS